LLGVLALHSFLRGRNVRSKSRSAAGFPSHCDSGDDDARVWLSFAVSIGVLSFSHAPSELRRICIAVSIVGTLALLVALSFDDQRRALIDRLQESGPVDFRQAVYAGGWQMFLEGRPRVGV